MALFAVVYGVLAFLCIGIRDPDSQSTLLWPAGGILLGALMASRRKDWLGWVLIAGALHLLAGMWTGRALPVSLVYMLTDLVVMCGIAAVWRKRVLPHFNLQSPSNLAYFLGLLLVGAIVGTVLNSLGLSLVNAGASTRVYTWFVADLIGNLVGAPLVIAWSAFRARRSGGSTQTNFYFGLIWFVLLVASAALAFDGPTSVAVLGSQSYELSYLPLLFVVLVALVWDQRGLTLATLVLALVAAFNTAQNEGPFADSMAFFGNGLLEVQGYIGAACLAGLLMTAIISTRNRALRDAAVWKLRFEAALQGSQHLVYEYDPASQQFIWAGDTRGLLGLTPSDLATLDAFLKHVHPADRPQVVEGFDARSSVRTAAAAAELRFRICSATDQCFRVVDTGGPLADLDDQVYRINGLLRLPGNDDVGHNPG
ncbi:membrane protein [Advenella kashmirensis W13003]|uniref:Membrane protein n=2 Tax=Advenella kashmirensis TaxID=310575 RepID=V8QM26_9BURK|nr:membrane protein [Advenella kashmirensis W13003]